MNIFVIILRIIHIFAGIFWIGVLWYNVIFFLPRVKRLGPDRGRIMQTLATIHDGCQAGHGAVRDPPALVHIGRLQ